MLIVCPHCASSYEIKAAALGDEGRSVRCVRCQTVWFASPRDVVLEAAGAAEAAAATAPLEAATADEAEFHADASEPAGKADDMADDPAATDPMAADGAAMPQDMPQDMSQDMSQDVSQDVPHDPAIVETIDGAPPLAPGQDDEHQAQGQQFSPGEGPFPITGGDVEAFRRRKASKRAKETRSFTWPKLSWPLAPLPTALLGLGATVAILIGWRTDVVRLMPQTASLYSTIGLSVNLRGVVFENIKTSREIHEGVPVIVVEGEIVSISRKAVEVPRLRFGVRNGLGAEIYNWTAMPSRTVAQGGERLIFRSRLASPPAETHDISVRFYNRRDAMAGR
jgi:predicted Zn finger-like uncharacterized protein